MILTIGGIDHTAALQEGSLVIRHYGSLRSSFSAALSFRQNHNGMPAVGEEILIQQDGSVVWGGILVELEAECHSTETATVVLRGQGYEQILQRYCLPGIELASMTPTAAAKHIFNNYLDAQDGLTLGTVESGLAQQNEYEFYPAKASSVFDYLAGENGFHWWVDKNKTFHMKASLPYAEKTIAVDLTGKQTPRLLDLQTFAYRASTAGYKNVQYAFNKTSHLDGYYRNEEGIAQMKQRYGSGEYGASTASSIIQSEDNAASVARQTLIGSPGTGEIEFTTDRDVFILGQIIGVTAPICGINTEQNFCITEIRSVYFYDRFRYTITAAETYSGSLSTVSWESTLASRSITELR